MMRPSTSTGQGRSAGRPSRGRTAQCWLYRLGVTALMVCAANFAQAGDDAPIQASARALEQRLRAPCCRQQMLDAHESELASAMRREIRDRLRTGETSVAIESDFVQRYGASIVAIPPDRDPRGGLSTVFAIALAVAAAGIALLGITWVRRTKHATAVPAAAGNLPLDDELDTKLDDELRRFD
jgi:cytochrome c-type biogenesis protein CcmH